MRINKVILQQHDALNKITRGDIQNENYQLTVHA